MSLIMQGNWAITVKSKSAAFAQQFIISGAAKGNGSYAGLFGSPAVFVDALLGKPWTVQIQNDPHTGVFQNSAMRATSPVVSGNGVSFEIESNDAGGDNDFNDLVLTCLQPFPSYPFYRASFPHKFPKRLWPGEAADAPQPGVPPEPYTYLEDLSSEFKNVYASIWVYEIAKLIDDVNERFSIQRASFDVIHSEADKVIKGLDVLLPLQVISPIPDPTDALLDGFSFDVLDHYVFQITFNYPINRSTVTPTKTLKLSFSKDDNAAVKDIKWSADSKTAIVTTSLSRHELNFFNPDDEFSLTLIGTDEGNGVVKSIYGSVLDGDYDNMAGDNYVVVFRVIG